MTYAVEAQALQKRFGALEAVRGVSFAVAPGEVFGLVGADGAGKTTILRMLCGLVDPDSGQAHLGGLSVRENLDQVKDLMGYMAQKFGLYGDLTVEENLDFYGDLFGVFGHERATLKQQLLEMTRMAEFRERAAAKLSGGMKQKLSLMCTLLHKPRILLLDEPTNGVDPVSRRDFWLILEDLVKDGLTVIVTTAYLDEAERCHRVALLDQGRIIRTGTPAELKAALPEKCYAVRGRQLRQLKASLEARPGVVSVQLSGAELHLFLEPQASIFPVSQGVDAEFERITPSLEDVLITETRRAVA